VSFNLCNSTNKGGFILSRAKQTAELVKDVCNTTYWTCGTRGAWPVYQLTCIASMATWRRVPFYGMSALLLPLRVRTK
jgi:hypothetical protein